MALLILGLGNDLLGDDGIGLLAAEVLENRDILGVKVVKSPLSGMYLVELVEGFDDLVVIDSIVGDPPGKVVRLKLSELGPRIVPSAHYLGLPEALALAKRSGLRMPNRIAVVAMQIGDTQVVGSDVSHQVREGLPALVEEVLKLAQQWGYEVKPGIRRELPAMRQKSKRRNRGS